MSWATPHVAGLKAGCTVKFRPFGKSMQGRIESGQLVTVAPVRLEELNVDDIVLCKVGKSYYLHLIKQISKNRGLEFLIGNTRQGGINGWTSQIFGKCINVED